MDISLLYSLKTNINIHKTEPQHTKEKNKQIVKILMLLNFVNISKLLEYTLHDKGNGQN